MCPKSKISLLLELFDSNTLKRIVKRGLNTLNFELRKNILYFFFKQSHCITVLHISNVWFAANDVLPAPMCYYKIAKSSFTIKDQRGSKAFPLWQSLKLKYEVLQELDKGALQKDFAEKYSIPKNTILTWKKNRAKLLACYEKGSDPKRIKL